MEKYLLKVNNRNIIAMRIVALVKKLLLTLYKCLPAEIQHINLLFLVLNLKMQLSNGNTEFLFLLYVLFDSRISCDIFRKNGSVGTRLNKIL